MSRLFRCDDPAERAAGLDLAAIAVARGELVVLPTDTVYGVGCDAFAPSAVTDLLAAKGRGRNGWTDDPSHRAPGAFGKQASDWPAQRPT